MKKTILFFTIILLFNYLPQSLSQNKTITYLFDPGATPAEKMIDVQHLTARLSIDPYQEKVEGTATFQFLPLRTSTDSINFYVMDMDIQGVTINAFPVRYIKQNSTLTIFPEQNLKKELTYSITINYESNHPTYLYFSGWNDPAGIKRKQIWAHRPVTWLPYLGDRLTVDMIVTFDNHYKVFSNGERIEVTNNQNGTSTWHYRMNHPHPYFSTALVIGDYEYRSWETARGLPLEMWYYPDQADRFETTYAYMEEMIAFFEEEMGLPYPWELYRQAPVVDYLYGAMETTTSTIFGDYMFVDERAFTMRNYINVNAHELAHQWFGNYISHLAPKDVWLTESFATYYAKLFERSVFGEDYYQNVRNDEWNETMEAAARDNFGTGHCQGGRARWYPKGSLILDMLRDVMGDDHFKTAIRYYLEHYPYQDAETSDFLRAIYYATGLSMDWFFDEWIYRGGEPTYKIKYQKAKLKNLDNTQIFVEQIHSVDELIGYFRMPVIVEVYYTDGTCDHVKEWVQGQMTVVEVPNPGNREVAFVLFDPGRRILKNVNFLKDIKELSSQALHAPDILDRYDALLALRDFPPDDKRDLLIKCYYQENFHLTKAEIISQLFADRQPSTVNLLKQAIHDPDDYVRRAVLKNITTVTEDLRQDYEILLTDRSYTNIELALENLVNSFPGGAHPYFGQTGMVTGWRGKNIRIKWLELAVESGKKEHLQELISYSSQSYEFETRQNALNALKRLNYLDEEVAENLLNAFLYWNFKLSGTAKEVFQYFIQQNDHKWLLNDYYQSHPWNESDKKKLDQLF
jgi:aminopeptidase N